VEGRELMDAREWYWSAVKEEVTQAMKSLVNLILAVGYIYGLALMVKAGFFWWTIVGALIPLVPFVFVALDVIERFG
jgi:fatty acid desaturase